MALWTGVITPLELTETARLSLEERERTRSSLVAYLPNRKVNDLVLNLQSTTHGLVEAAEYRAYDAETPIGGLPGGQSTTVTLPALGQKVLLSEYDQLRLLNNQMTPQAARYTIGQIAARVGMAVADRIELMRGQVLETGRAVINENQFKAESDFNRDSNLEITPGVKWDQAETATPLEDLQAAVEQYVNINGEAPAVMLVSSKIVAALMRSKELRSTAIGNTPAIVTKDYVNNTLTAFGLPMVKSYDRKVKVGGQMRRVIDEKKVIFLPSEDAGLGATFWGTTLESSEPNYGIAEEDRPGIAVGAYKSEDPMGVWVHANAIGMPVLANANLTAVLNVLT